MSTVSSSIYVSNSLAKSRARATHAIPWYLWCIALALACDAIGGPWDISWHRTIGRDSFLNPAHVLVYLSAIFGAVSSAYLILSTTFNRHSPLRSSSIQVMGLRGPLGAFCAAWGGIAMLTSAPFDNWWHNAYGLDVKIISPPHSLLFVGTFGIAYGAFFLLLAHMNRAESEAPRLFASLQRLLLFVTILIIADQLVFLAEYIGPSHRHSLAVYNAISMYIFLLLAFFSESSRYRWTATTLGAGYMVFVIGQILVLPLFPAHPKLGPVYNPVTHMVPTAFPLLLIVPGFVLDMVRQRTASWRPVIAAAIGGVLAFAAFVAVEWPFAAFLLSDGARNRFFGGNYASYGTRPEAILRHTFNAPDHGTHLAVGLLLDTVCAALTVWVGTRLGQWMREVQR